MPSADFLFSMLAVVVGSVGGTLLGIAGGLGGDLARKGERRLWIEWSLGAVLVVGAATAVTGVAAWLLGHSAWSLLLVGLALSFAAPGVSKKLRAMREQASIPAKTETR